MGISSTYPKASFPVGHSSAGPVQSGADSARHNTDPSISGDGNHSEAPPILTVESSDLNDV